MANGLVRSFIAVDIEDESVLSRILSFQQSLAECGCDLKPVSRENIHITLRFLGELPPNLIEKIKEELSKVSYSPFNVEFRGTGVFPNLRHINVVWVGIHRGAEELTRIFSQLEPKLRTLGVKPDNRGFSPHLTVARLKSQRNREMLTKTIMDMENHEFGSIPVNSIKLKKSVLTPKGPIYSTLHELKPQS